MAHYNFVDSWNMVWNDVKPLVGKISFCEPNTTTLKTIYTVDGQELQNPIYCNGLTTNQVMLEGDYTVRFYEYIGNGNMESDENEASWRLYKTELVKQNIMQGENDTEGVYATVTTINQLKDLEVPTDGSVVGVVGYYTVDDCPLRYYVWHEAGNYTDDGGVVIKSNNASNGAWVMKIPGSYIDVRWYGDIPARFTDGEGSTLGQRAKAATAANTYNKDLYFPAYSKGGNGYYMFDGSNTVSVAKDIITDTGVRWIIKHGTNGTSIQCHELFNCDQNLFMSEPGEQIGGYSFTADWIRTSWYDPNGLAGGEARVGYIIDRLQSPMTFTGTKIKVEAVPTYQCTFDNCEMVECYKQLTNNVIMSNMEVKTDWFVDNYSWSNLSISNCRVLLKNCKDANTYVILKNKQLEADYGDLGEQTLTSVTLLNDAVVENAAFNSVTLAGDSKIHNVTGSVTLTGQTSKHNWIDCWLTVSTGVTLDRLVLRRGTITSSDVIVILSMLAITDGVLSSQFDVRGGSITLTRCTIGGDILHIGNPVVENITDCRFDRRVIFRGGGTNATVNCVWTGNCGIIDNPLSADRTNLASANAAHSYVYDGNCGTFLGGNSAAFSGSAYVTSATWPTTYTANDTLSVGWGGNSTANSLQTVYMATILTGGYNRQGLTAPIGLFRVGTDPVTAEMNWYVKSIANTALNFYEDYFTTDFNMKLVHVSGDRYSATQMDPMVSDAGRNLVTTTMAVKKGPNDNPFLDGLNSQIGYCMTARL